MLEKKGLVPLGSTTRVDVVSFSRSAVGRASGAPRTKRRKSMPSTISIVKNQVPWYSINSWSVARLG